MPRSDIFTCLCFVATYPGLTPFPLGPPKKRKLSGNKENQYYGTADNRALVNMRIQGSGKHQGIKGRSPEADAKATSKKHRHHIGRALTLPRFTFPPVPDGLPLHLTPRATPTTCKLSKQTWPCGFKNEE